MRETYYLKSWSQAAGWEYMAYNTTSDVDEAVRAARSWSAATNQHKLCRVRSRISDRVEAVFDDGCLLQQEGRTVE